MAVERQTTNFNFNIPVISKTYKTEIDANWDSLDSLLKAMTQSTTHTSSGAAPSLDITNSGAGVGIKVDKLEITTSLDASAIANASSIEILPNGVSTTNGIKFEVASNYLKMVTNQSSGFEFFNVVKFDSAITLAGDLNLALKINSAIDTAIEIYSEAGLKIYPDSDDHGSVYLQIAYESIVAADGIEFIIPSQFHVDCAGLIDIEAAAQMYIRSGGEFKMFSDGGFEIYPDYDADAAMVLKIIKNTNEIKMFGSNGDSIGIESEDKIELRADDSLRIYPDYDGAATKYFEFSIITDVLTIATNQDTEIDVTGEFTLDVSSDCHFEISGLFDMTVVNSSYWLFNNDLSIAAYAGFFVFPDKDGYASEKISMTVESTTGKCMQKLGVLAIEEQNNAPATQTGHACIYATSTKIKVKFSSGTIYDLDMTIT